MWRRDEAIFGFIDSGWVKRKSLILTILNWWCESETISHLVTFEGVVRHSYHFDDPEGVTRRSFILAILDRCRDLQWNPSPTNALLTKSRLNRFFFRSLGLSSAYTSKKSLLNRTRLNPNPAFNNFFFRSQGKIFPFITNFGQGASAKNWKNMERSKRDDCNKVQYFSFNKFKIKVDYLFVKMGITKCIILFKNEGKQDELSGGVEKS